MEKCCRACDEIFLLSPFLQNKSDYVREQSRAFCYTQKKIVYKCWLTTNYLFEPFLRLDKLMSSDQISPSKNSSKLQHLHSCFHLKFIVFNHRWIFLLNGLFLLAFHYILVVESLQRPTARGENRIDFACHFRFSLSLSLSRCMHERIEESMASVDVEHKALVEGTFYSCCMLRGHFPSLHYQPNFHESISFCVLILLTQNRWKNHDRSKYSTRQSRLARNDI